jgi:hypothetical protein
MDEKYDSFDPKEPHTELLEVPDEPAGEDAEKPEQLQDQLQEAELKDIGDRQWERDMADDWGSPRVTMLMNRSQDEVDACTQMLRAMIGQERNLTALSDLIDACSRVRATIAEYRLEITTVSYARSATVRAQLGDQHIPNAVVDIILEYTWTLTSDALSRMSHTDKSMEAAQTHLVETRTIWTAEYEHYRAMAPHCHCCGCICIFTRCLPRPIAHLLARIALS